LAVHVKAQPMPRKPVSSNAELGHSGRGAARRSVILIERIERAILLVRGHKVMLSSDLAVLYGVEPRALVQAVKRNLDRFPPDFMFQLAPREWENLKSQFVISSWGGARSRPFAFTEQGVAMLSSVLNSPRAVAVNIEIMRAFVRLRQILASHADLARRLDELEQRYDAQFKVVFDAIRELMKPPDPPPVPRIGFITDGCRARGPQTRARKPRRALATAD
jgi:hypothetical protein